MSTKEFFIFIHQKIILYTFPWLPARKEIKIFFREVKKQAFFLPVMCKGKRF